LHTKFSTVLKDERWRHTSNWTGIRSPERILEITTARRSCLPAPPARRHGATVSVQRDRQAVYRPPCNEGIEIVRGLGTAPILQAVLAATKLASFWRIAPQRRIRVPWIPSVSPSMTLARPARSSVRVTDADPRIIAASTAPVPNRSVIADSALVMLEIAHQQLVEFDQKDGH
jgi:hypothetical protein